MKAANGMASNFLWTTRCLVGLAPSFSRCNVVPLRSKRVSYDKKLTLGEGRLVELGPPFVGDMHELTVVLYAVGLVAMVRRDPDELLGVVVVYRVQHVKEIGPVGQAPLGKAIREVEHHSLVTLERFVEVFHTELYVSGRLYPLDFGEGQQLLSLDKDHTEEILVEHGSWRDV